MAKTILIADKKHRVILCSAKTTAEESIAEVQKFAILASWAAIEEKKASQYNREGVAIRDSVDAKTHEIYINYRPDLDISVAAWIYESRLKSPPRWFKVLKIGEMSDLRHWCIEVHLTEKSESSPVPVLSKPTQFSAVPLPGGVKL